MFNLSHKIFAVFAVFVFALNMLYASFVWINFKANQEYIANNLCIEKDIEESTCNGSCHLKEELDKVEESKGNSKEEPINISQSRIDVFFFNNVCSYNTPTFFIQSKTKLFTPETKTLGGYLSSVFHPPIVS